MKSAINVEALGADTLYISIDTHHRLISTTKL